MFRYKKLFSCLIFILLFSLTLLNPDESHAAKKKKHYEDWRGVAADMALEFNGAIENVKSGNFQRAYDHVNDAYFKYYEVQGFERSVLHGISNTRVNHIEAEFGDIKLSCLKARDGNEINIDSVMKQIEDLKIKVYKDALVLDGIVGVDEPDSEGEKIYTDTQIPRPDFVVANLPAQTETKITEPEKTSTAPAKKANPVSRDWLTFITAFGLLVREGLEAILVIVAIVAYLIKTGNKEMLKGVYLGSFAAILASVLLAWFLEYMMGDASGVARELLEGWTMFLAVAVLFYVSNWMLSKADNIAWENYISGKVQQSIDSKSQWTLIFAAFIAVMREGAELILFYEAAFTGGMSNPVYIAYGIAAGVAVLVAVWVAFRYFSVKLPLRAFFLFTSILLFLMCISFMGKGVTELTEADVITGRTTIPAMKGFSIEILSIYDRAETLIPQIMLVIASLWILIPHLFKKKNKPENSK